MTKYKANSLYKIEKHMERTAKESTNPDIKTEQSRKNIDLSGNRQDTFYKLAKKRLAQIGIKKWRSNAVILAELMFSASPEFFENMTSNEIRSYFQSCFDFAAAKYGRENIVSAEIHLDEKTPHMHLEFIPISKDKLCAKALFDHKLGQLQTEAHQQVFSKYGLDRGKPKVETQRKHITTERLKVETAQKEYKKLSAELEQLLSQIEYLKSIRDTDQLYKTQQKLISTQDQLQKLKNFIRENPILAQTFIDTMNEKEKEEKAKDDELTPML